MDDIDIFDIISLAEKLFSVMNEVGESIASNVTPEDIKDIALFHSKGAAAAGVASGWVPGFGGAIATATTAGFVWGMYLRINNKIGLSISENILKTLASGVATNLAAYAVGSIAVTTVLSFLPFVGNVGASVIAGSIAFALTIVSAGVYLIMLTEIFQAKHGDINKMSADDLKDLAKEVIDNNDVESALKQARKVYEKEHKE